MTDLPDPLTYRVVNRAVVLVASMGVTAVGLAMLVRLGAPPTTDRQAAAQWMLGAVTITLTTYLGALTTIGALARMRDWSRLGRIVDQLSIQAATRWLDRRFGRLGVSVMAGTMSFAVPLTGATRPAVAPVGAEAAPLLLRIPELARVSSKRLPDASLPTGNRVGNARPTVSPQRLAPVAEPVAPPLVAPVSPAPTSRTVQSDGEQHDVFSTVPRSNPPTAVASDDRASPATCTVVHGDHLWGIAERTVHAARAGASEVSVSRYWLRLIAANRDVVTDPDRIFPGQELLLPAVENP